MKPIYNRVLIKLSGEAIGAEGGRGIDEVKLSNIVDQIIEISKTGCQIGIVIGAGNFWRGKYGEKYMERTTADYMGMLATTLNALALQEMIESKGYQTRVMTAITMQQVAEPYIRRKAIKHLEKGRITIFGCGLGNPYFTTDSAAALRAIEIEAEAILLAKNVDGVYDKDPKKHSDAIKFENIKYSEAISKNLGVMDITALTLCMENNLPIKVFGLNEKDSLKRAITGAKIGTLIEV